MARGLGGFWGVTGRSGGWGEGVRGGDN